MRFHSIEIKGKIWIQVRAVAGSAARHRGVDDEGRIFYSTVDEKIWFATSTEWKELSGKHSVISSGSRMLFGTSPLPENWNLNATTIINGKIIMVTNDSDEVGNYSSGTWTITGMDTADSHDHGGTLASTSYYRIGKSDLKSVVPKYTHIHTLYADGVHQHTFNGTWRPAHVKLVEAEYS